MHMPRKLAIPVVLAVAACLGAYYVWLSRPVTVGDWTIYQGTGRLVEDADGTAYLDASYAVRSAAKPLFSYVWRAEDRSCVGRIELNYQSEWPVALRVVFVAGEQVVGGGRLDLPAAEVWTKVYLTEPVTKDAGRRRLDFYDGAGTTKRSTAFSNRIKLMPPADAPDGP